MLCIFPYDQSPLHLTMYLIIGWKKACIIFILCHREDLSAESKKPLDRWVHICYQDTDKMHTQHSNIILP